MHDTRQRSFLDDYCSQLGVLLERRYTERALVAAKEKAEGAARLAEHAMRQAQAADHAKTQFLATVTHELRTPLNAIIGFSELLDGPGQGENKGYAKYIRDSGSQLLAIVNGVLDLARIEAGKLSLEEQDVALAEVVDAAIRLSQKAADEKSISISRGAQLESVCRLDPTKMTQVFVNLLSNAINFTPENGRISIGAAASSAGDLSILIEDTGAGIAAEDIERVLQPFSQSEDHLTRQTGGLGLGLPIARALVRLHDGELMLSSEIGRGTTAEVRLPAVRLRASLAAAAP